MTLKRTDHLVLTVASIETTCRFYAPAPGSRSRRPGQGDPAKAIRPVYVRDPDGNLEPFRCSRP